MDLHHEWFAWARTLEAPIVFLLVLPFVVAGAGLFAEWRVRRAVRRRRRAVAHPLEQSKETDGRSPARAEAKRGSQASE